MRGARLLRPWAGACPPAAEALLAGAGTSSVVVGRPDVRALATAARTSVQTNRIPAAAAASAAGSGGVSDKQRVGPNADPAKFSQHVAFNTKIFNPKKMKPILLTAMKLPGAENENLRAFLERAREDVEREGKPWERIGPGDAIESIVTCRRLDTRFGIPESKALAATLVSTLGAEILELPLDSVVKVAQQMLRHRLRDPTLWEAVADASKAAPEIDPATLVELLDTWRRSLSLVRKEADSVFLRLCVQATTACKAMTQKQLVSTVGSISRLGNHIPPSNQQSALQLLLDQWLYLLQASSPSGGAPASHYISLAVSLTNISQALHVRTAAFVDAYAAWAQQSLVARGDVGDDQSEASRPTPSPSPEEWVLILWTLKELTPLGLGPHAIIVSAVLPLVLADEVGLRKYTLLRLLQTSEVILAARLIAESAEQRLIPLVASCLADEIAAGTCSADMLARIVALWDQVGELFWADNPQLTVEVVDRARRLLEDAEEDPSSLHRMLGTLIESSFASTDAFAQARAALSDVVAAHPGASSPGFATLLQLLAERAPAPERDEQQAQRPSDAAASTASGGGGDTGLGQQEETAAAFRALSPVDAARKIPALCARAAPAGEVDAAAERALAGIGSFSAAEAFAILGDMLRGTAVRRRLVRQPVLLELVEQLADVLVASAGELPALQLTTALEWFAVTGLPYHLLFEATLVAALEKHRSQALSWRQVVGTLEAFAQVRLRIPELEHLYAHLRQPHELARLPAMALIRFFSASARLDLLDEDGVDARELLDRVLAETTPQRPLPLDSSVLMVQSLFFAQVVLADRQFRHLFGWVALTRLRQLTPQQLAALRQYSLFLLSNPDAQMRGVMLRLPIEIQRFISGILGHRAPAWVPPTSDTTRSFRSEVAGIQWAGSPAAARPTASAEAAVRTGDRDTAVAAVPLGPAGVLDLQVGGRCWFLDGPEAFFRPFTAVLRHTPQERARAVLMGRLLGDDDSRRCVADFFPPAAAWPRLDGPHRINWLQWGRTAQTQRAGLFFDENRR